VFYCTILIIINFFVFKNFKYIVFNFVGLLGAGYCGIDDILGVYFKFHIGFFPNVYYSRFSYGITIFILFAMASLIKRFIDQAKKVEQTYITLKEAESELVFLAYNDSLTGLPNRKSFYEKITESLLLAERSSTEKLRALLLIDLNKFKQVNDTLGHNIGDQLLMEVSNRLKDCLRRSDYVFRIGGDEFSIVLNKLNSEIDISRVANKIINAISSPFFIENHEIFLGSSIGIGIYPKDGQDIDTLIKCVDAALFEAKKENNKFVFYDKNINELSIKKMSIEDKLRKAIDKKELYLNYQPIVDNSGKIIATEALLRWKNNDLGLISPVDFIPIAEDSGLIISIGDWVFETAQNQLKQWKDNGVSSIKMAINVSTKQFKQNNFVEKIEKLIKEFPLNTNQIEIEITESCMMEDPEDVIDKMNFLSKKGIHFSIDDFGTGYSSLNYIKKLPISKIKIDQSFIRDMINDPDNKEITKAIIAMSHNLKLSALAEGVETKEQMDLLSSLECDEMQGYYFSRPISSEDFLRFFEKHGNLI